MKTLRPANIVLFILVIIGLYAGVYLAKNNQPDSKNINLSAKDARESNQAKSAVLITIDTLRGDHLGFSGNEFVRTPTLDSLSRRMTVFPSAYTNLSLTVPAHTAMLTSHFPRETGVRINSDKLSPEFTTVQEILLGQEFSTAAYPMGIMQFPRGLEKGFQKYFQKAPKLKPESERTLPNPHLLQASGKSEASREIKRLDEVAQWIRDQDAKGQRYFVWLHLMEPHLPYNPKPPERHIDMDQQPKSVNEMISKMLPDWNKYDRSFTNEEIDVSRKLYQNEVLWTDQLLRPLLYCLSNELKDAPFVLITADHGETLHDSNDYFGHGYHVTREELSIPFLAGSIDAGSDFLGKCIDTQPVQSVDVAPTILSALGFESPDHFRGIDVLNTTISNRIIPFSCDLALPAVGAMDSMFKVQFDLIKQQWACWDRVNDPAEKNDLLKDNPEFPQWMTDSARFQETLAFAESYRSLTRKSETDPVTDIDDPEFRQMLEKLGYLQ